MTSSTTVAADARVEAIMRGAYTLILTRDPEGTYSAHVAEFPGCFSGGDTAAEAASNLEAAMAGWIESELEAGRPIPAPMGDSLPVASLRYDAGEAATG